MLTGRRTKLAIAVAILIVGVGAAFLFRREEPAETPTASRKTAASDPSARSSRGSDLKAPPAVEPSLAGRIEPYGWDHKPADVGDQTAAERAATTAQDSGSKLGPVALQPEGNSGGSSLQRPASYRSSAKGAGTQAETSPKRQTVNRPSEPGSAALPARSSGVFERFADHRPLPGAAATGKRHKIIDGDTLAAIAQRYLGAEGRYLDLFEHNRDVLATPELLPIGKELRIPPPDFVRPADSAVESRSTGLSAVAPLVAAPPDAARGPDVSSTPSAFAPPSSSTETYIVQAHDTLALIARKVYGDIGRQSELMAANRQQLRTPRDLRPGMTLVVPAPRKPE
ncbi:MAG: LysM peptidoglycan-binding domain-containing protein [Pirellulales bacterium]